MRKTELIKGMKKAAAGCLAAMMVVSGFTMMPKAADEGATVYYESMDTTNYWSEAKKTAPVKQGYVFGGWYKDENGKEALRNVSGTAYAKWVPATVLSVKTQSITDGDKKIADSENSASTTDLRLLSAVDSTDYQYCGFDLLYGEQEKTVAELHITKVYQNITFESNKKLNATETFGTGAEYFFALNSTDISKDYYGEKIYVRPYWVTLDGTKVSGLAKNVRVEDHYTDYDYYSLSVNLFGGDAIAAGKVQIKYDSEKYEIATNAGDDALEKKILKETGGSIADGVITIVANGETVNQTYQADGLFLNIRLQKKEGVTEDPTLTILDGSEFCNWNEEDVNVIVQ